MLKRAAVLGLSVLLAACGNIPVASVPLPSIQATLPVTFDSPVNGSSPVIYINKNQLEGQKVPEAIRTFVNSITVTGTAIYAELVPGTSDVRVIEVYVRQGLTPVPQHCSMPGLVSGSAMFCEAARESDNRVGSIDFTKGQRQGQNITTSFTLGGPALLSALKATPPSLYVGFRIAGGKLNEGDKVTLTNMQAVAKF